MYDGIQRDAAHVPGGWVAQLVSNPSMKAFMDVQCQQYTQRASDQTASIHRCFPSRYGSWYVAWFNTDERAIGLQNWLPRAAVSCRASGTGHIKLASNTSAGDRA